MKELDLNKTVGVVGGSGWRFPRIPKVFLPQECECRCANEFRIYDIGLRPSPTACKRSCGGEGNYVGCFYSA